MTGAGRRRFFLWALLFGLVAYSLGLSFFAAGWSAGPNYRNVSVDAKVNITNSAPVVFNFSIQSPQTLSAGSLAAIVCNVTIRDYNGPATLRTVNATLFHVSASEGAVDDNNTHYTNSSCAEIPGQEGGIYKNYTCTFGVAYHALNGTWNCTARVNDSGGLTGVGTRALNISPLYALNVSETVIDYGDMAAGEFSPNLTVNISNLGNMRINTSVLGYGGAMGDNLSFVCDYGNISIGRQRYAANDTAVYAEKINLTGTYRQIPGLSIDKATNASGSQNSTYWQLFVDPNEIASGNCSGVVVFQAGSA